MIEDLNTAQLKTQAVDTAAIGAVLHWMGELQRVDITDDGRKIAYPLVRTQKARAT